MHAVQFLYRQARDELSNFAGYTLASTSGSTSIAINTAGGSPNSWTVEIIEAAWSGSTMTYDAADKANRTSCTSCAGVSLTLAGASDLIVQWANPQQGITAITGGAFTSPAFSDFLSFGPGYAAAINTTNATAPTWTSSPSGQVAVSAIAIKGS